jgi:hypothetical protein
LVIFIDKTFPDEKQFRCPCPLITPVISLIVILSASPILCPQIGQPERENDTSPGLAGMEVIEATLHFHPTLLEIWTNPAENLPLGFFDQ